MMKILLNYSVRLRNELKNNALIAKKLCNEYENYVKKQKIYSAIDVARKVDFIARNELNITDNNYNILSIIKQTIKHAKANKLVLITRIVKTNAIVITNIAFTHTKKQ